MTYDMAASGMGAFRTTEPKPTPARSSRAAEMLRDEAPVYPTTPIYARKSKASGLPMPAIAGGGVALAAIAGVVVAVSWPGASEPVEVAATPVPTPAPMQAEAAAPAPMTPAASDEAPTGPTETSAAAKPAQRKAAAPTPKAKPAPAKVARAKPAPAAASASATSQDASALLPDGPMPYVPDASTPAPAAATPAEPSTAPSMPVTPPPPIIAPPSLDQPATAPTAAAPVQSAEPPPGA